MTKWIGWVEDSQGFMVRFIGPTTRAWAQRKVNETAIVLGTAAGEHTASDLEYALRTKFADFRHLNTRTASSDLYYSRLPIEDLNLLINVVQGWK
jgi:hypothetical protein